MRILTILLTMFLLAGCSTTSLIHIPQVESIYIEKVGSACTGTRHLFKRDLNPDVSVEVEISEYISPSILVRFRIAPDHTIQLQDNKLYFMNVDTSVSTHLQVIGAYTGIKDPTYANAYGMPSISLDPLSQIVGIVRKAKFPMKRGEWSNWRDIDRAVVNLDINSNSFETQTVFPDIFEITLPLIIVDGQHIEIAPILYKRTEITGIQCIQ